MLERVGYRLGSTIPRRLAIHEAGHCVVRDGAGLATDFVVVGSQDGKPAGATHGTCGTPEEEVRHALAGTVAEKVFAGEDPSKWSIRIYGIDDLCAVYALCDRGAFDKAKMGGVNASVLEVLRSRWAHVELIADSLERADGLLVADELDELLA